jgi:hypothetical protein
MMCGSPALTGWITRIAAQVDGCRCVQRRLVEGCLGNRHASLLQPDAALCSDDGDLTLRRYGPPQHDDGRRANLARREPAEVAAVHLSPKAFVLGVELHGSQA